MACDALLAGELAAWIARVRRRIAAAGPVLKPALELELGLLESLVKDVRALERPDGTLGGLSERVSRLASEVAAQIGRALPDSPIVRCLPQDLAEIAAHAAALERLVLQREVAAPAAPPTPAAEEAASPLAVRLRALASVIATGIVPLVHRQHAAGLAEQLHALAGQVGETRLTGVRLRRTAEALRGRTLAQPWQSPSAELVASIVARLREAADALAREATPPAPPAAAANVIDLASRRRGHRPHRRPQGGDDAA